MLNLDESQKKDLDKLLQRSLSKESARNFLLERITRDAEHENYNGIGKDIAKYLNAAERDFLYERQLYAFQDLDSDHDCHNIFEREKDIELLSVQSSIAFEKTTGGFVYTLPLFESANRKNRGMGSGKYIRQIINRLNEENKNVLDFKIIPSPLVVFEHHYTEDRIRRRWIPDADNLDAKAAIDAIQGWLIADDNLLLLSTMHIGTEDKKAFTKMHVMQKGALVKYMVENHELFA